MLTPQEIAERALGHASGPGQLAVIVTQTSQVNLRWAANTTTTNGALSGTQVDIVAMDRGTATVSGQVRSPDDVTSLVDRARAAAADAPPVEDSRPLPSPQGAAVDWADEPGAASPEDLRRLAQGLAGAFTDAHGLTNSGYAERDVTTTYLATTTGTVLRHEQVQGRAEFTARADDGRRSAWEGFADPDLDVDVESVMARIRESLAVQRRPIRVPAGPQTVILSPSATADLMVDLYYSADARSALEGRSVFAGPEGPRLGDVLGHGVTLSSDPQHTGPGMRCAPFEYAAASSDSTSVFDNGLPLTRTEWVADGRLANLVSTRHTSTALGRPVTPGIDNLELSMAAGHGSVADLISRTERGLLITCLWYNRVVDPQTLLLTGLTRDGVYVVRDGALVGAAGNFRYNESPVSLLGRILDASDPERTLPREMGDYFNRVRMPALVTAEFNLSTASEAH